MSGADEKRPRPRREEKPAPGREREPLYRCDLCGFAMLERHCKIACPQCGYLRDCSDP